jgi:hypothetical protein
MSGIFSHIWVIAAPVFMYLFCSMKSPRFAAHTSPNDHWGFYMAKLNSRQGRRTKNTHMKSPRARAHPAPMIIWGFHVTIKKQ